ncbi:MAG: hypothetical protein RLY40_1105 [Pseudomonadota bacterium]|jgi:hypothetical protein
MISLLTLKKFIAEKKLVNLSLILQTFGTKQEETLAILELLIHKGCIKKCFKKPNCATTCLKCSSEAFALYQWIEPADCLP